MTSNQLVTIAPLISVRNDIMSAPTINTLPNTTCQQTLNMEMEFLKQYNIRPYLYEIDQLATVIYSRTLNTHYLWPRDQPLTIEAFEYFKSNGHTLGIDNTKSYCRIFALDLDCICRAKKKNAAFEHDITTTTRHLNLNLVNSIVIAIKEVFAQTLNIPNVMCSIWENECGYHVYTNVNVSLPTHLYLAQLIAVKFVQSDVIFEVPSIMPLPYSAKVQNRPYVPSLNSSTMAKMALTMTNEMKYVEFFEYSTCSFGIFVAKIEMFSGTTYVILNKPIVRQQIPRLTFVREVNLEPEYKYMDQLLIYITNQVGIYNQQMTKVGDIDFSAFDENIRFRLQQFMVEINSRFVIQQQKQQNCVSCNRFIEISAIENGALHLQHFVVALYKFMKLTDFEQFRQLLRTIYSNIFVTSKVITRFVNYIDLSTMQAYNDSWETIINHLHFLAKHGVTPFQTLDEQINTVMCSLTHEPSHHEIAKQIKTEANGNLRDIAVMKVWAIAAPILKEFHVVYRDSVSYGYHIYTGDYYKYAATIKDFLLPPTLHQWMANVNNAYVLGSGYVNDYKNDNIKFTKSKFMFPTSMGLFNSVTGLYSSKTRFLRFDKFRNIAIWDNEGSMSMYSEQNEHIVEKLEIAFKYSTFIHTNISKLYMHMIIAPALIQMRDMIWINEQIVKSLLDTLAHHKDYSTAFFLIEYFPFDPKFIYLIMYIMCSYGNCDTLTFYNIMCERIIGGNVTSPDVWRNKFNEIYKKIEYDNTKATQMEKLLSLSCDDDDACLEFDENTCFVATIIAACQVQLMAFRPFVSAFNVTMPPIHRKNPDYANFNTETTIEAMQSHIDRAIRIVFGENLSAFEMSLIYEIISLGMSTNFTPEFTSNLLDSVSLTYVPMNVNKKLIIYFGEGDGGKTFICDKLQKLAGPMIGCIRDLNKDVIKRAEITSINTLIIISEAKNLSASILKSITGNDAISQSKFFTQNYELLTSQALMFSATNSRISFNSTDGVDNTTIDRLHGVTLVGKFVNASDPQANILSMMLDRKYFKELLPVKDPEKTCFPLGWLAYAAYVQRRDVNFSPFLDVKNRSSREYKKEVYYHNNPLYRLMIDCGIIDEPLFSISTNRLLKLVKDNLQAKGKIQTIFDFKNKFILTYGINLDSVSSVNNFQEIGLIEHVKRTMYAVECANCEITRDDFEKQLEVYNDSIRNNAANYFATTYSKYYCVETKSYKNLTFKNEAFRYDNNDKTTLINVNPESLVLNQV